MFRVRFHGRGGQGIKTAGRILGTALFETGFEVQDAPRYGAERRGAPIFAYVRASREPITERGAIHAPDLVVVADDSLMAVPAADVLNGISPGSVLLVFSEVASEVWRDRLALPEQTRLLAYSSPVVERESAYLGTACTAGAAGLIDEIDKDQLEAAIGDELSELPDAVVKRNLIIASATFDALRASDVRIQAGAGSRNVTTKIDARWVNLGLDAAHLAAPSIEGELTSVQVNTGLWRTMRPVVDYQLCRRCWWVCSTFCPDDAISVDEQRRPIIDYMQCKGCLICVAQCPPHAITAIPETVAAEEISP